MTVKDVTNTAYFQASVAQHACKTGQPDLL